MVKNKTQRQIDGRLGRRAQSTLSKVVYNRLVDRIIRGRIRYGDRLNIKTLARQFGVSPMPIRDAIKRLEAENVVVVRPRSTCYVRMPTQEALLQAVESRHMLEMFAVQKAYRTVTRSDLSRLAKVLQRMAELVATAGDATGPVPAYIELDHCFHAEICRLAGNEYIQRFYRETSLHLSMSFRYGLSMCHGMRATFEEHKVIYGYLAENSELAVAALQEHLERARQNVLREHQLDANPAATVSSSTRRPARRSVPARQG
jgi:DNA-binding GntR family transcriptional regulator